MRRCASALIVLLVVAVSCYAPHYGNCYIACGTNSECPDGFRCSNSIGCVANSSMDVCTSLIQPDAGSQGGGDGGSCSWSYTPTNFDACALPMTTSLAGGTLPTSLGMTLPDGTHLIHLASLSVPASGLTLTGSNALIIASDGDVTIDGTIQLSGLSSGIWSACSASSGVGLNGFFSGGGGGGLGFAGGSGGPVSNGVGVSVNGGSGGRTISTMYQLAMGCPGADGGAVGGGSGGPGGGALQISSNGKIHMGSNGAIDADGFGGSGGSGSSTSAGGGGGGASGGTILLEAVELDFTTGAELCAVGGGGGQGGTGSNVSNGSSGHDGSGCVAGAGGMGGSGAIGSAGGTDGSGFAGASATVPSAGGGGGGGAGQIFVHAATMSDAPASHPAVIIMPWP